jgi:pimeloyl-ACP methyl ester carboxylesterase
MAFREGRFTSQDGLALYYRDYGDPLAKALPVVCLAGLTRNSIDFHAFAERVSARRRVLAFDYRGRGRSQYDPQPARYTPETYLMDVSHLLTATGAHRAIFVGTSLGGILAMALGALRPTALAGVVLNDIGPELDPRGLARIGGYVGKTSAPADWDMAVTQMKQLFAPAYPDLTDEGWLELARQALKTDGNGRLINDYDFNIAQALAKQAATPFDGWALFGTLKDLPVLAIRGALSDLLSAEVFERMADAKPDLIRVTVPNRGHVPLLTEPECVAALDDFLERHGHAEH